MRFEPVAGRPISAIMYTHDGFGFGHLGRNLNIAKRLVREVPDTDILMIVGCPSGIMFEFPTAVAGHLLSGLAQRSPGSSPEVLPVLETR